jgi:hypothetical protein
MKIIQTLSNPIVFFIIAVVLSCGVPSLLTLPLRGSPNFGDEAFGPYICGFAATLILFSILVLGPIIQKRINGIKG